MDEEIKLIEEKKESLIEKIDRIAAQQEQMMDKKKEKKWKLPWGKTPSNSQASKGYATFQIIRENGEVDFVKAPIYDLTAKIDGFPRIASPEYRLTHKGKPFYIIPSWSMKPFSPVENYAEVEKDKMHIAGRRVVLASMETEQIKSKKSMGMMLWVILGIAGVALLYYMLKGGKLF